MNLVKPLPSPTPTSQPFWDALQEEKVRLQRCDDCGTWIHYPRSHCSSCLSDQISWHEVSGNGTIYTYTVTDAPTAPQFQDESPQKIAVVELDEPRVRLTTTLVNTDSSEIKVGMQVKPYFDAVSDDITLLRFQPA
jgi:uncharacterized OB-fold protein